MIEVDYLAYTYAKAAKEGLSLNIERGEIMSIDGLVVPVQSGDALVRSPVRGEQ